MPDAWEPPSAAVRRRILRDARTIAVVGASANPARASNFVLTYLASSSADYEIWPITPRGGEILGMQTYPSLADLPGEPDIVDKLKAGHGADGRTYKVHIDGYNLLPYLTGETEKSPRQAMVYFSDDGDLVALRFDNWKVVFMEQRAQGTLQLWAEPFVPLRIPKLFNLRTDPFERADITSNTYYDWLLDHAYLVFAAQGIVTQFLATFQKFPPRQKPSSFTIDQALEKMQDAAIGAH